LAVVSPVGSWLTTMDATMITSTDTALQGIAPYLAIPVTAAAILLVAAKGVKVANGDAGALQSWWFDCVKIVLVLGLSLNIGNYDYYVRDFIYTYLPGLLTTGVVAGAGVANGVQGVGASLDALYLQTGDQANLVMQHASWDDFGTKLAAFLAGQIADLAYMAMALVYLLARLILGVVLVFGPVCIACSLAEATASIFHRWLGKCFALVCLQVAGVIVLVMVFAADNHFMQQIAGVNVTVAPGWLGIDGSPAPDAAGDLQNLMSMVVWVGMGAFALYSLPAIAYSIGSGVALHSGAVLGALGAAAGTVAVAGGALLTAATNLGGGSFGGGGGGSGLSMSLAEDEIAGGGYAALPPPPPPSLSGSTPLSIGSS
jgi:type IV secretion system protein VirB6